MTNKEAIRRLDAAIADVLTYNTPISNERDAERDGERVRAVAIKALKDVGASEQIQRAVKIVYFGKYSDGFLQSYLRSVAEAERQTANTYMSGVKNVLEILTTERERHKRIIDDMAQRMAIEEQKRGNAIQSRAYWIAIVSMLISLIALIVAILK